MKGLLAELHGLIEKKIDLYGKFIVLLEKQWDCVTAYSIESLEEIGEKKEELVERMQILEKERARLMLKIERALGVTQPGVTLKKLIQSAPEPIGMKLAKARETLLGQIITINQWHEQLRGLMDRSSLSMKKSLAFIHSQGEAASSPYRSNGKVKEGSLQGRMLSLDA